MIKEMIEMAEKEIFPPSAPSHLVEVSLSMPDGIEWLTAQLYISLLLETQERDKSWNKDVPPVRYRLLAAREDIWPWLREAAQKYQEVFRQTPSYGVTPEIFPWEAGIEPLPPKE